LLVWGAEASGPIDAAVVLDNEAFFLADRAKTFDGRDIFVPVAANLLLGVPLLSVGSAIDPAGLVRLRRPFASCRGDGSLEADVVQVDGFGNVQLSAGASSVTELGLRRGDRLVLAAGGKQVGVTFASTFSDVAAGDPVLLVDSDGQLAYSVNGGRADRLLPVSLGTRVNLRRSG
jgi:S-adenosylmethionine hydrolase